jgi:hypothetical protein
MKPPIEANSNDLIVAMPVELPIRETGVFRVNKLNFRN